MQRVSSITGYFQYCSASFCVESVSGAGKIMHEACMLSGRCIGTFANLDNQENLFVNGEVIA